jgi:hypothetical protein
MQIPARYSSVTEIEQRRPANVDHALPAKRASFIAEIYPAASSEMAASSRVWSKRSDHGRVPGKSLGHLRRSSDIVR